jgi:TolB protein
MTKKLLLALLVVSVLLPPGPAAATYAGDNGRIAFRRFLDADRTHGAIFTVRPDGTGERQVTRPPAGFVDRNPDVSPDGRRIAFQRQGFSAPDAEVSDEIYVVNSDGSHLRRLTRQPAEGATCDTGGFCDASPAWSPDGRRIAFSRASGPVSDHVIERVAIYSVRADGSHVHRVTQQSLPATGEDGEPQWSPDGHRLVFQRTNVRSTRPVGGIALWVLDLRTGAERRITRFPLRAGDTPDWSPDGRRILFHDNQDGPQGISANLFTVAPNGRHLRQLTFARGGVTQYLGSSYSPDGRYIAVGRRPATGGVRANTADVYVLRADGTHLRRLTRTRAYDSYPDWGTAVARR